MTLDFTRREHSIRFIQRDDSGTALRLFIPDSFAKEFDYKEGDTVTIRAGKWEKELQLMPVKDLPALCFGIHSSLFPFPQLLSTDTPFRLERYLKHEWRIGPVVGLLVNDAGSSPLSFGALSGFAEEMARHAAERNTLFFVYPFNQIWTPAGGSGFFRDGVSWITTDTPLPDVIYNRLSTASKEQSDAGKSLFSLLKQNHVPYFNERFIYKWEMHELLARHEHLHPFLPETVLASDRDGVLNMTRKHGQLYIKPVRGREGNGIIRLTCEPEGLCAEYPSDSGREPRIFRTFDKFYEALRPRLKKKPYLVQQGIPLFTVDDGLTDIRVLTVKNEAGEWQAVSKVARCGVKDQIVSNVAKGGEQRNAADVLTETFSEPYAFHLARLLNELAVEIASAIDSELGNTGVFGEFGIDIGISADGRPWILEVNTKPSKSADPFHDQTASVRPSVKTLIAFSRCLSGVFD
ncbi:YheC/YheD family endospore coat-associated protein [Alteribacter lacisalsi]|nr:YheC/YheD family protein [Alteribacter lacisalsi]